MGASSSKPAPHRIEPEATGVEVFQNPTSEAPQESKKRQKAVAPTQGAAVHVVRTIMQESMPTASGSETANEDKQAAKEEKQKKKRRRSKKEKNKTEPPKLVRAQTQLNELKNVKPLLQQTPQARQQHFEQIQVAYALDEEAKKAPSSDSRSRFFHFESWRKSPQLPSGKGDSSMAESATSLARSQSNGVARPCSRNSVSNDIEDIEDSRDLSDVETIPLPPVSRMTAITAPTIATTPNFLTASNQVEYGRPDIQTTPVIRVKTSDRQTPERAKHSLRSQRSDLRLDDVDEDLMEHILTNDYH
ncbi:hypothetical protein F444_05088 [Phytophthora nicotianae P1976]|uniref:Uncharacterized protein n=1 Tax=Phytophthora nicotianae P1976 TaxID=1317066 RepID=A0A081ANI0_PHYNI|nr:hypothetical protein F444_05088 [Phytophthora nicotianae P1976]